MSSSDLVADRPFVYNGTTYILTPPNLGTESLYVRFLERRAVEKVQALRDAYGDDYREALAAVGRDKAVGVYEWGQREWARSLSCDVCFEELAWLCMLQQQPNLDRPTFHKMWQANYQQAAGGRSNKIADALLELMNRPNSPEAA